MSTFQKRPDRIDAIQWFGDRSDNPKFPEWFVEAETVGRIQRRGDHLFVSTPEARYDVSPGTWVFKRADGTLGVAEPREFERQYEPA